MWWSLVLALGAFTCTLGVYLFVHHTCKFVYVHVLKFSPSTVHLFLLEENHVHEKGLQYGISIIYIVNAYIYIYISQ
jgi:hypothetical protein